MQINAVLLQSLSDIQRQLQHGPNICHADRWQTKKSQSPPEIQKCGILSGHTRKSTSRKVHPRDKGQVLDDSSGKETSDSEGSSSSITSSHSWRKWKKRNHSKNHNLEEFKKAKPPSFDSELKKGEEVEAWLLGLKKYFKVHYFSKNLKARVATFNLNGKNSIWWEDLKNVKGIHEEDLS